MVLGDRAARARDDLLARDRRRDAAPHLIPIWGAWVDGRWYVEGGPTRWQRNLRANPQLAIHVEFGEEVVIVEGTARELVAPPVAARGPDPRGLREVQRPGYEASASHWTEGGLWELTRSRRSPGPCSPTT